MKPTPLADKYFSAESFDIRFEVEGVQYTGSFEESSDPDLDGICFVTELTADGQPLRGNIQLWKDNSGSLETTDYDEVPSLDRGLLRDVAEAACQAAQEMLSSDVEFDEVLQELHPDLDFISTSRLGYYAVTLNDEVIGTYEFDGNYSGMETKAREIYDEVAEKVEKFERKKEIERFNEELSDLGLKRSEFAREIGYSKEAVTRHLSGKNPISPLFWLAIDGLKYRNL